MQTATGTKCRANCTGPVSRGATPARARRWPRRGGRPWPRSGRRSARPRPAAAAGAGPGHVGSPRAEPQGVEGACPRQRYRLGSPRVPPGPVPRRSADRRWSSHAGALRPPSGDPRTGSRSGSRRCRRGPGSTRARPILAARPRWPHGRRTSSPGTGAGPGWRTGRRPTPWPAGSSAQRPGWGPRPTRPTPGPGTPDCPPGRRPPGPRPRRPAGLVPEEVQAGVQDPGRVGPPPTGVAGRRRGVVDDGRCRVSARRPPPFDGGRGGGVVAHGDDQAVGRPLLVEDRGDRGPDRLGRLAGRGHEDADPEVGRLDRRVGHGAGPAPVGHHGHQDREDQQRPGQHVGERQPQRPVVHGPPAPGQVPGRRRHHGEAEAPQAPVGQAYRGHDRGPPTSAVTWKAAAPKPRRRGLRPAPAPRRARRRPSGSAPGPPARAPGRPPPPRRSGPHRGTNRGPVRPPGRPGGARRPPHHRRRRGPATAGRRRGPPGGPRPTRRRTPAADRPRGCPRWPAPRRAGPRRRAGGPGPGGGRRTSGRWCAAIGGSRSAGPGQPARRRPGRRGRCRRRPWRRRAASRSGHHHQNHHPGQDDHGRVGTEGGHGVEGRRPEHPPPVTLRRAPGDAPQRPAETGHGERVHFGQPSEGQGGAPASSTIPARKPARGPNRTRVAAMAPPAPSTTRKRAVRRAPSRPSRRWPTAASVGQSGEPGSQAGKPAARPWPWRFWSPAVTAMPSLTDGPAPESTIRTVSNATKPATRTRVATVQPDGGGARGPGSSAGSQVQASGTARSCTLVAGGRPGEVSGHAASPGHRSSTVRSRRSRTRRSRPSGPLCSSSSLSGCVRQANAGSRTASRRTSRRRGLGTR